MTVLAYVNTSKQIGDADHIPQPGRHGNLVRGDDEVAFEYEVLVRQVLGSF